MLAGGDRYMGIDHRKAVVSSIWVEVAPDPRPPLPAEGWRDEDLETVEIHKIITGWSRAKFSFVSVNVRACN